MNRWRSFLLAAGVAVVGVSGYFLQTEDGRTIPLARERVERGRFPRGGGTPAAPVQNFVLDREYLWPSAARTPPDPVTDPVFGTGARRPIAVCYVGAVTGSTTAFECKGRDGLAYGTMFNNSVGTTVASGTAGIRAMQVTHADVGDSPELRSTALDAIVSSGTYTVLVFTSPKFNADNFYWVLHRAGGTSGNLNMYSTGADNKCSYTSEVTTQLGFPIDAWGFLGCSVSGGTSSTVTYQYDSTTDTIPAEVAITGTGNWVFANRSGLDPPYGDLGQDGMIGWFAFYDVALTAAEKQSVHDAAVGAYNAPGSLTGGSSVAVGIDFTATTGSVDMVAGTNNLMAPGGLVTSRGYTNLWSATPLSAASWTDVGTPTINANITSGPFAVWQKAAECDEIVDDSGAAFEGKQSDTAGTGEGYVNATCYLKAGLTGTTTTKARIAITVAGGTGSTDCDFTGLTSTAARKECLALAGDTPTSIKASLLVGNAAAETGSIQACQCQLTVGAAKQPPMPSNTGVSKISYALSAANWGIAADGAAYEIVHTPSVDPDTQWTDGTASTYYLLDPTTAGGVQHAGTLIYGYQLAGRMYSQGIITNSIGLTPGQPYAWRLEWRPTTGLDANFVVRHDSCGLTPATSCVATTERTTATDAIPGQPEGGVSIGVRTEGQAFGADALVNALRTYVLQ